MSIWHINGGNTLTGSTSVQGAKNAVLPIAFIRFLWLSREVRLSANCVSVHK